MLVRVAVIGNGIGQVQRLSYLRDIQMKIEQGRSLVTTVCMDCVYRRNQTHVQIAVVGNGTGQVQRLNYLCEFQRRIEQGRSLCETVCMDCVTWLCHMPPAT